MISVIYGLKLNYSPLRLAGIIHFYRWFMIRHYKKRRGKDEEKEVDKEWVEERDKEDEGREEDNKAEKEKK